MPPHISREACMGLGMDVACAHAVARLKAGWRGFRPTERAALHDALDVGVCEFSPLQRPPRAQAAARSDFVCVDELALQEHPFETEKPPLVIGAGEVHVRRKQLDAVTPLIDVPRSRRADGA